MAVSSSSGPRRGAGPTPPAADIPVREVVGTAQLGRRTKLLVKRLRPTDIAIIDHQGIDRVSAEELIATGVRAVVNCRPSPSERYPNMGPLLLAQAGVHLVDVPGAPLFDRLRDGDQILVRGGEVIRGSEMLARGEVQDLDRVQALTAQRREEIGQALESFARNTVE